MLHPDPRNLDGAAVSPTQLRRFAVLAFTLIAASVLTSLSNARAQDRYDGPVTELAVRLVTAEIDVFTQARDAFVAALVEQPGVSTDREFVAILDGTTFEPPSTPVFVGMTEYDSFADFATASEVLGPSDEATSFFGTFSPLAFTALRPLDPSDRYALAALADTQGQVLEIAVRDLSTYADFDPADYDARRLAFLAELTSKPGVVAEYQWMSVLDPNVVVGMTVYESADAFQALAGDADLLAAAMPFIERYPTVTAMIVVDAR